MYIGPWQEFRLAQMKQPAPQVKARASTDVLDDVRKLLHDAAAKGSINDDAMAQLGSIMAPLMDKENEASGQGGRGRQGGKGGRERQGPRGTGIGDSYRPAGVDYPDRPDSARSSQSSRSHGNRSIAGAGAPQRVGAGGQSMPTLNTGADGGGAGRAGRRPRPPSSRYTRFHPP